MKRTVLIFGLLIQTITSYSQEVTTFFNDPDKKVDDELYGEYCFMMNEITLYWKNIKNIELLTRTIVHEYQHYLQSPSWFTRYYNMGYNYNDHPYEVKAFNEEETWLKFV